MEEFEKLSVKTLEDLPRTLDQVEAAGKEWDELGQELRELLTRVERWGQFSGADEALTKLTASVLEEPSRAIRSGYNEAESYVKRLTDDFAQALAQLTDWESRLTESVRDVEEAAFRETWGGGRTGRRPRMGRAKSHPRARANAPREDNDAPWRTPYPSRRRRRNRRASRRSRCSGTASWATGRR